MNGMPPAHVPEAFGLSGEPAPAGPAWDDGWIYGDVVLSRVADASRAAWSAKVLEQLAVDGARVAHPVRTSDGRHVLAGWRARLWCPGRPEPRADETMVACGRLEEAMADVARPRFATAGGGDVFDLCDRAAWAGDPIQVLEGLLDPEAVPRADAADALAAAGTLLGLRGEVDAEGQLVHGDAVGTVLYDAGAEPVFVDLVPRWHPAGWSAAVAAVDSIAWGGADEDLLARFDHLPNWDGLLARAICYRLFVHAAHPESRPAAWRGLGRAAELVRARLG